MVILCHFAFSSCLWNDDSIHVENITIGSKWTLSIGSSPSNVYSQLQALGKKRVLAALPLYIVSPIQNPEDIENLIDYYNAVTMESNQGVIERAYIQFVQDTVNLIEAGNAILDSISIWPQDIGNEEAI